MQSKDWCFTINNPETSDIEQVNHIHLNDLSTYLVYQAEQGAEGTIHLQGFVQMAKRTTRLRMSRLLSRAHLEVRFRKSKPSQAAAYCKKDEGRIDGPFEYGELDDTTQGKRTDFEEIHDMCKQQKSIEEMLESHPGTVMRNIRNIKEVRNIYIPDRNFKTICTIIWGWPKTGKTYWAMHAFPKPYKMNDFSDTMYIADYDPINHETIVFDDYHGGSIKFGLLKQLMDEYPMTCQTKGGFVPFRPKHLVITTNLNPTHFYKFLIEDIHFEAFFRRVENIIHVDKNYYYENKGTLPYAFRLPKAPHPMLWP